MRIADHVEILEIIGSHGTIYPVLLWDKNNIVLVDAGFPLEINLIDQAVTAAGLSLDKINTIILTHQDIDHIGCVKELTEQSPNIKVMAHEQEVPYIDGSKTPLKLAGMAANFDRLPDQAKVFYRQLKSAFDSRRIKIDKFLTDHEVLPICGGIEIIHTPGHTPGHICLYLRDSQILISGDALIIDNGQLAGANPQHTHDLQLALESIEKLKNYAIKTVITYHGGPYQGDVPKALSALIKG